MNLRSVDMNLLVILDALLDEQHVGRAGERVGLSQPAMSAALQRCRVLFRDELLERTRGNMRPTPRGLSLRQPLKELLAAAEYVIDPPTLPIGEVEATLRLTMSDLSALLLLEQLLAELAVSAPRIDIVLQPWNGADGACQALKEGATDIAVSIIDTGDEDLCRETLSEETYVVAMREDHPAARDFAIERWLAFPHIVVSGRGNARTSLDRDLAERGLRRRTGVVVPTFGLVVPLLRCTHMIAMVPKRLVSGTAGLAIFQPPIAVESIRLSLAWHRRRRSDPVVRHVASSLAASSRQPAS
ncbi:LysR substrate-binding domain-containing protein [Qipengyuania qiaonensis]|uniref:LysR family transcriptional regulator n=1 Tax=Qipengyuania qiaonensis TaxID=2867240 RepID=A0ABS7J8R8_9SPHN|nr:LysR substrate-binding domain-containing protein [Qipengyuania qiaonensis]MBX7483333.1 LysR family transcriptional regulator [Qipengyuania qiaonensis]